MPKFSNKKFISGLGLLGCAVVWGATFFIVKDALNSIHPVVLVAYRFIVSALVLVPLVARKKRLSIHLREGAILSFWLSLLYLSQTWGLQFTTASNSGFITGLFILFVPLLLLVLFKQKPNLPQWIAIVIAVGGLWMLTGGLSEFNMGDSLTLIAAFSYAAHLLITDKYVNKESDTVLLAFHQFWMTGLTSLVIAWILGYSFAFDVRQAGGAIFFLGAVAGTLAFLTQMTAQKFVSPIQVALIFSMEPVFAAIFAWTLGGESFQSFKAMGGGLIVTAMIIGEMSKTSLLKSRKKEMVAA